MTPAPDPYWDRRDRRAQIRRWLQAALIAAPALIAAANLVVQS